MGLKVGGYNEGTDWPKLGPSLLIASALILAIRTAKWPAERNEKFSNQALQTEIDFAISLANAVLSTLLCTKAIMFPRRREPWFQPDDDDIPE